MQLLVDFDVYTDLFDVPQCVIENRERYRKKFLQWVYDPKNKKRFTERAADAGGQVFEALTYGGADFLVWLNTKALRASPEKARIIAHGVQNYEEFQANGVPLIFF